MIEGLTDEVMTLVEQSSDGLTLGDLYDQSQLADSQQAVAGAVHRLTTQGLLVRGTDKRVRTKDQARKSAAQAPAKAAPVSDKPKSIRDEVVEVIHANGPLTSGEIYRHCALATNKQQVYAACSQLRAEGHLAKIEGRRYRLAFAAGAAANPKPELPADPTSLFANPLEGAGHKPDEDSVGEPVIHIPDAPPESLERVKQLNQRDHERLRQECSDIADRAFEKQEKIDGVDAEVEERQAALIREMGIPISGTLFLTGQQGGSVSPAVVELLERASQDAQEHLDDYISELDDPVLDYLIEVASSTKELAEAARAAAGGAQS